MLGRAVHDPQGIESDLRTARGLGLLPVETTMADEKRTEVRDAVTRGGVRFTGYEIHVGASTADAAVEPFARFDDGSGDGACGEGVLGTYLHGALEHPDVCAEIFCVPPPSVVAKAEHYARLADWLEQHGRGLSRLGLD
jgi:adenosylcobyric acid synthase